MKNYRVPVNHLFFKKVLRKLIPGLLIIGVVLFGCSCPDNGHQSDPFADVVWQTSGYGISGNFDALLADGIIYQPESLYGGISATRASDGVMLWQISKKFALSSNPVLSGERLYILSEKVHDQYKDVEAYIWVLNKTTGEVMARVTMAGAPDFHQYEWWLAIHQGWLYFQCYDSYTEPRTDNICRIAEASIELLGEVEQIKPVEKFLQVTEYQRVSIRPVFEQDYIYIVIGGNGSPIYHYPTATPKPGMYYPQDVVKVSCRQLDGTLIWETGLQYAGEVGIASEKFILSGNHLYLGDWSGRACLNKADGSIVWEQAGFTAGMWLVLAGNRLYGTCYTNVYCFDAATGNQLWQYNTRLAADSNPILWNGRLYCVMADALRVFNPETGKLLYEKEEWGIPGMRSQGFIPQLADMLFLPFTNEIVALRLRDL